MMYNDEKKQIIEVCHYLQDIQYFLGTWGNVSLRIDDHILLTPSRVNYDTMKPDDIVVIDLSGNKIEGQRNPTSEKEVHRQIYCIREDVRAVIHAHTEYAMAVSAMDLEEVPCIVEEMSQMLGGSIPLTKRYIPAAKHEELGKAVAEVIGDKNSAILRNHGPVACGRNMDETLLACKVTEKACKIFLSTHGDIIRIPEEFAASERYRYLYTYGKEKT